MVVLSDGQPNVGLQTAQALADYVRGLKLAVSSLGFGLHHDENVLDAIATAGSGRYAYIPDPSLARVELARAALAHGGIVADHLELKLKPAEGVELVRLLPTTALRVGGGGVTTAIGDVFIDEGRALAIELALDLGGNATGRLMEIIVEGKAPDGTAHRATATLQVDLRAGARVTDKDAQCAIILVQADAARADARSQADRGALPAAAAIMRQIAARIDAVDGFVKNDGSVLAELREQLEDEAANYERTSTDMERAHQRKASTQFKSATPGFAQAARQHAPLRAALIGIGGPVAGHHFELYTDTRIGRSTTNEMHVDSHSLSRCHARVLFVDDHYLLQDMGSTNGSEVNGSHVHAAKLADGDLVKFGEAVFRFRVHKPQAP
jgi:Ca-activated chloride channel family protein